jgi:hypothetical protein
METSNQIIRVVRGQAHWSSLQHLGFSVRREPDRWIMPPVLKNLVVPKVSDVAAGILSLRFKPDELREWASFVLAASSLISLERIDETHLGKNVIEALWDLSFGKDATEELIQLAESAVQAERNEEKL